MNQQEYIKLGLNGKDPLKVILKGSIEESEGSKVGVVSLIFVTTNLELAKQKIYDLISIENSHNYYMVYSVPFDTDLTAMEHFPSIAINKTDLE